MGKIIGIDLGTTNSVVAIIEGGQPKVLVNAEGFYTTPSVVAYGKKGEILIGQLAKRQAISNPENTIFSSKRFIGRAFKDVQKEIKNFAFQIVEKPSNKTCVFKINNEQVSPEKIASFVLSKLKKDAEAYLGQEVKEAVITVPAYFNDAQRQATKDAGRVAGLTVKRVINEPTAAALAYGLDKKKACKVAVYDFGGGTFDISLLEIADQVVEVKSTNGDTQLGGDNFDEVILNWLADEFKKTESIDLRKDKMALQRLREAAEKAKIELSSTQETSINLPFITSTESGAKHLEVNLTRTKFNQLTEDLVAKSLKPCKMVLKDANLKVEDIDEVIMVGGSTRIPTVQESVKKFFKREPNLSMNPDQVVAQGAAIQAGVLSNEIKDVLLLDVTPLSLGIETLGGVMTTLITKNTTIPTKKTEIFSTAEDNQTAVSIHVLQGERDMASGNQTLGKFDLKDIPLAQRGVPQIEVSFDIDVDGIIQVQAKDKVTGKTQNIKISRPTLSEDEIGQMVKEAEIYEEQDRKQKEFITEKNQLDQLVYQTEKLIKENSDKDSDSIKEKISDTEAAIVQAKETLQDNTSTVDNFKDIKATLSDKAQALGTQIYKEQAESSKEDKDENNSSDSKDPQDDAVDVDYDKKEE